MRGASGCLRRQSLCAMATFTYRCPVTNLDVQARTADNPAHDHATGVYETVTRIACMQVHLVESKSGRVLGTDQIAGRRGRKKSAEESPRQN
jgi:hypothetical protein